VEQHGKDDLIVVLGAPDADSAELYAETLVSGDPSWAGPLAGVALELPIEPSVYKEHLELMEIALDVERIAQALDKIRKAGS